MELRTVNGVVFMGNEKYLRIYDYSLGICGMVFVALLAYRYGFEGINLYLFLFLILSEIVIDKFMIHIRRIDVSLSIVVDISGFLIMGLVPSLFVKIISIFVVDYVINKKPVRSVFLNIGMFVFSISAGAFVYNLVINSYSIQVTRFFSVEMLPPTAAFIAADIITNYLCVILHIRLTNADLFKTAIPEGILWDSLAGLVSIPLSLEFSDIYMFTSERKLWFSILFLLPIIFACFIVYLSRRIIFANRQLKALERAALAINSSLDLEKIYNVTFDTIGSIVGFTGCYIFEYDPDNKIMKLQSYRTDDNQDHIVRYMGAYSAIFSRIAGSNEPFILHDLQQIIKKGAEGGHLSPRYKSCMMIPLRRLNKCAGCIGIFSDENHAFNDSILEFLMILADQTVIAIENAKLFMVSNEQAITDNLTYLYNQRYFYKYLDRKVEEYSGNSGKMSVIMFDIDFFKKVNDKYGHVIGDYVLKEVAMIIKSCVRKNDIVARYGGEEFTVVLPGIGSKETYAIAERVREKIEAHVFSVDGNDIRITISGGISEYPGTATNSTELVNYADRAMYVGAKFNGRNKIKMYAEL